MDDVCHTNASREACNAARGLPGGVNSQYGAFDPEGVINGYRIGADFFLNTSTGQFFVFNGTPRSNTGWEDISNRTEMFSVLDYGADETASLDSRNAFQRAFNAARAVKGTVILPPGDFRINSTKPLYIGEGVNFLSFGGRIWNSLPDDYTNTNDYVTAGQFYTATNVLDENGNFVTWNSPAMAMPWNGKTEMFTRAENSTIEGIWIDFGWGTTNAPAGVRPITGIRDDNAEYTFYQGFNDSRNVLFSKCKMWNCPGSYISVGYGVSCDDDCRFGEFADHVFYFGQASGTQREYRFSNNRISTSRAAVGTLGQTNYVFRSFREALKFRGNISAEVIGNKMEDSNDLTSFILMEVNSSQPGDIDRFVVTGNNFRGSIFADLTAFRLAGGVESRIRRAMIDKNIMVCATGLRVRSAVDGLSFSGNDLTCMNGTPIAITGHPRYVDAIKDLVCNENKIVAGQNTAVYLAGQFDYAQFKGNKFRCAAGTITSGHDVFRIANPFAVGSVGSGCLETRFKHIEIKDNVAHRFYSYGQDSSYDTYNPLLTYAYNSYVMPEGVIEEFSVVLEGGVLYRNTATVTGVAPPGAGWQIYTLLDGVMELNDNKRHCSEANLATINNTTLFYFSAAAGILHMNYNLYAQGNQHFNTLGEASDFITWTVGKLVANESGALERLSVGIVSSLTSIVSPSDFTWSFVNGDQINLMPDAGAFFLDIGHFSASGDKQLRVWDNLTVRWALSSVGYIEGGEVAAPAAPAADRGRIFFRDVAGKTQLAVQFATGAIQPIANEP